MIGANSLPKTVTRQRRDCDLNPGPTNHSATEPTNSLVRLFQRGRRAVDKTTTYDGDVVDGGVVVEQYASAVDVVALDAHVQRTEPVLGLGDDRGSALQQQVHHLVVAAASSTMQRRQTVLPRTNRARCGLLLPL